MNTVTITIEKKRPLWARRNQYTWTAVAANGRKLANGGESYNNLSDLEYTLGILFGETTHKIHYQWEHKGGVGSDGDG